MYCDWQQWPYLERGWFPAWSQAAYGDMTYFACLIAEVINAPDLEKTIRIVVTSSMVNHDRFIGAFKESLVPACEKVKLPFCTIHIATRFLQRALGRWKEELSMDKYSLLFTQLHCNTALQQISVWDNQAVISFFLSLARWVPMTCTILLVLKVRGPWLECLLLKSG